MIIIASTILGILAPIIFGLVLITLIARQTKFFLSEIFALSFALGVFFITMLIFIFSWLGLLLTLSVNILLALLFLSIVFIILRRVAVDSHINHKPNEQKIKLLTKILTIILFIIIAATIIFVFFSAWWRPIIQYDALATWSLKAKIFFSQNKIILNQDHPYFLGIHLLGYPLQLPLWQDWQSVLVGSWFEPAIKLTLPIYYLSLLIILYSALRRTASRFRAMIFTFFLATMPFVVYHARHDYADLILSFYVLATAIYFWRGWREENRGYFILGAILAASAAWTKNEGLALSIIILVSSLIYSLVKKKFRVKHLISAGLLIALVLPWLIFKFSHHLSWANNENSFKLIHSFGALSILFNRLIVISNWNIWWLIFILLIIFNWRSLWHRENSFLFFSVLGCLIFYLALYVFTDSNNYYLLVGVIDQRNLLTIAPLTIFYGALLFFGDYVKIES
ncbi:MAG: glycosyltransferase family 39 protein [Patescibacteria group bacterium]|nr:glycosyltransferase family 39 protein [Patescibacteria group bacterium]MDD5121342.1 glycosyltransferase family 39 protein [Patescibacteria group bacterium]MDD5222298.1 glycosyltransferase family 39 protein [Patescibacteria group bacterium]MDD5395739.1 glycosyltransferase family 39 protein [Patescibacteria group bacterium]